MLDIQKARASFSFLNQGSKRKQRITAQVTFCVL